ncbi:MULTISPECIES: amino acid ABC transporter permease [unclassified Gilliamella]|uniref:amino acid ABC transporter permease n=1 Tax=unclassified Gilliamella TaxID=2685620 RepID=UPI0013217EF3|nr:MULTISPECIES: amino acid ABC transporter permease [unclassified Gilliamella]MWN30840.1 ABC transporter permease subunit [Gilliamella sp. Pra-s60]MWP28595.1 ABC transporter permease subunit [Gilliamella sp. Pra-s54]
MMGFNWDIIQDYLPLFIDGAIMTVTCTVVCVVLGTFWGLILGIGRVAQCRHGIYKYVLCLLVKWPVKIYVSAFRGTPLFVQIMVVYFVVMPFLLHPNNGILVSDYFISPQLARYLRVEYGAFISCILAITLNAGAYISEIFRAGIESIDKGQMEAARSLGMGYGSTMRKVILPQAFRRMLPPLGNNAIAILKDSSLGSAIGLIDLAYAARTAGAANAVYAEPYFVISLVYWSMTFLLSLLVKYMEKRLSKSDSH